ncbi:HNH endonuclease [Nitrincola schmidtii]|uniref:HNH endonuclease n=1 Tax=Nitrincola schmidtii TaxID=1730894 RepID=UPI001F0D78AC|nr:HNH endonuclease [Nitrincola schmidtii]
MKNKKNTLQRQPTKATGVILPPTHTHGPVLKVDINEYLKEKSRVVSIKELSSSYHLDTELKEDHPKKENDEVHITTNEKYLSSEKIRNLVLNGQIQDLQDLWSERHRKILYREDACIILARLRFLEGIDPKELPYTELLSHESVEEFEPLSVHNGNHIPTNQDPYDSKESATADQYEGDKRYQEITLAIRDGQARFRNMLLSHYGCMCMVTGEKLDSVIEAAHISPYDGNKSNNIGNGLLLRVDIHRLFDKNLLAIEPNSLTIHLHPSLEGTSYSNLDGKKLLIHQKTLIDLKKLGERFKLFRCQSTPQ